MKKLKLLFCFSLLALSTSLSFGQGWNWGRQGYGTLKPYSGAYIATTNEPSVVYVTGYYWSSVIFNPDTLLTFNENDYLVKYDAAGNLLWTTQPYSPYESQGTCIATDIPGYIYTAGNFGGIAGFGKDTLSTNGNARSYYLTKYDSGGHVIWARQASLSSMNSVANANGVAVDNKGHILITGYFYDTISIGINTLTTFKNEDVFLAKYDTAGNILWVKQAFIPSAASFGEAMSVTSDDSGNAYITGAFGDTIIFDADTLISGYNYNGGAASTVFLVKYSPSGNVIWARQSENGSINSYATGCSVITDTRGNPYITGYFLDTAIFGTQTIYSTGYYSCAFLTKYDTHGNALWSEASSTLLEGTSLSSDMHNNIYLAGIGTSTDSVKFRNLSVISNISGSSLGFLVKFDTAGDPLCGSVVENLGCLSTESIASNLTGSNIYTSSGYCSPSLIFGNDTLIGQGNSNIFVGSWQNCAASNGINELKVKNEKLTVSPNPFTNTTTISLTDARKHYLEVDDITGRKLRWIEFTGTQYQLQAQDLAKGIYFIRAYDSEMNVIGTSKIVVQ